MNLVLERLSVIGRIVKDAEILELDQGNSRAIVFPLAVNHQYKDRNGEMLKRVNYYDVAKWYSNDKDLSKQLSVLKKGALISVIGYPKARGYLTRENKVEASINITVETHSILSFAATSSDEFQDASIQGEVEALMEEHVN